jgi:hypothetical protein
MMRRIAATMALTALVSMPLAAHAADKKPSALKGGRYLFEIEQAGLIVLNNGPAQVVA